MAGHSKWSKIKRAKAANDAKRSKVFTRLLREIQVAAKLGGGELSGNARLKRSVDAAKSQGVPGDNIEKAIKRGTGDLESVQYDEITYEAYGPGGVGFIIKVLTDNKNRTVAEVRHALSKNSGNLASSNAVAYQFSEMYVISVPKSLGSEEEIMDVALEAGASDIQDADDMWEVFTEVNYYDAVLTALSALGEGVEGESRMIPDNTMSVSEEDSEKVIALYEALDDLDDVQDIFSNAELKDSK